MGLFKKLFVFFVGFSLAFYFYSGDEFKPEMLKGKRIIVTGASTGIGEQIAYHLAQMGSKVLITARREERLKEVVAKCLSLGAASAHYIAGNMDDMVFAETVVKEAKNILGGLDMLILNHIGHHKYGYFSGNIDEIRKLIEVNFLSYATMTVAALPMLEKSNGSIVAVSSLAGKIGVPFVIPYASTKFALDGFFSSLRLELALQNSNVSISLCILSYINTDAAVKSISHVVNQTPAPKEECALEIIKGAALRKREIYYEYALAKFLTLLRTWAPEFVDYGLSSTLNIENMKPAA
ncbi:11-beta-hydroxysteroid dehydrogenase 1 [Latimeria chalumnae]|uniref:11-beta-hydroxysteroid dehydrogenase 1 n=1 Tax=Latimeria chalumnae TaxID=7897 RepID=UPI0003C16C9F|nr:PREDICTED: corticosteroid 11-beta-dehydrogenase isozyme 1 [Latimeria chalumnae]|eukprot:XP_005987758.1 PREDICTED: corticosteroid 11-beta-dehydrogenase isozyme 1 [Latimeria chalumnae]